MRHDHRRYLDPRTSRRFEAGVQLGDRWLHGPE